MVRIEQAIFTSAATDRRSGYHLAAASPGIGEADAKELAVWGPSHDSLWDCRPAAVSVNFHPLPSGAFCVSRTVPSGVEPSGRGTRIYTQCLVVGPASLARFGNNPFALLESAEVAGLLAVHDQVPRSLSTLELSGRTAAVDQPLLERLAAKPGAEWMAALVQASLDSACLAVTGMPAGPLVAGLMNCIPIECRTEFSFTTGLRFSVQRPFRIVALPDGPSQWRVWQQRYNLTVLDFAGHVPADLGPRDGWARLVEKVLSSDQVPALAMQLSRHRPDLMHSDLPALALQLIEELDATARRSTTTATTRAGSPMRQAHAAHEEHTQASVAAQASTAIVPPSKQLHPNSREVQERLERLDDLVFEAMAGKPNALETLKRTWPRIRLELGEELLAESHEQYLRYALSLWEEYVSSRSNRDPSRAVQALDVLCVLFDRL
jgi:hypothetical protein